MVLLLLANDRTSKPSRTGLSVAVVRCGKASVVDGMDVVWGCLHLSTTAIFRTGLPQTFTAAAKSQTCTVSGRSVTCSVAGSQAPQRVTSRQRKRRVRRRTRPLRPGSQAGMR